MKRWLWPMLEFIEAMALLVVLFGLCATVVIGLPLLLFHLIGALLS